MEGSQYCFSSLVSTAIPGTGYCTAFDCYQMVLMNLFGDLTKELNIKVETVFSAIDL